MHSYAVYVETHVHGTHTNSAYAPALQVWLKALQFIATIPSASPEGFSHSSTIVT